MSVVVDELEVVPEHVPAPPGEPAHHTAPDLPGPSVEQEVERVVNLLAERSARLRAD
jgi:hypothetical protein